MTSWRVNAQIFLYLSVSYNVFWRNLPPPAFVSMFYPVDAGSRFLRSIDSYLRDYSALYPTSYYSNPSLNAVLSSTVLTYAVENNQIYVKINFLKSEKRKCTRTKAGGYWTAAQASQVKPSLSSFSVAPRNPLFMLRRCRLTLLYHRSLRNVILTDASWSHTLTPALDETTLPFVVTCMRMSNSNPLIRYIGNYSRQDLQAMYRKYIHKRIKHRVL
jgi:hypothetical protein